MVTTTFNPSGPEILERIDLVEIAKEFGLRFASETPGPSGYVACHAFDRDDRNPSAGFNVETGHYRDHAGDGVGLSYFDLLAALDSSRFPDWKAAKDHCREIAFPRGRRSSSNGRSKSTSKAKPKATGYPSPEAALVNHWGHATTIYTYSDNFVVGRWDARNGDKRVRPAHRREDGDWVQGAPPGPYPLYVRGGEEERSDGTIAVVEGEKCVDRLAGPWLQVATSPFGAKSASKADWSALAGREVVIFADNDPDGEVYAADVAGILRPMGCKLKIVRLPGLSEGGDVFDYLEMKLEPKLWAVVGSVPWEDADQPTDQHAADADDITPRVDVDECVDVEQSDPGPAWPDPIDEAAYHGVIGDLVRLIDPHTEADPSAVLIQALVTAGSVIGRGPYYMVGDTAHHLNLYAVIVGESSKARKGTSGDLVIGAFRRIEDDGVQEWIKDRRLSGLSSGEGLIHAVRDPLYKTEPIKEKGLITGYQDVLVDPGEADKRLLVAESEYGNVLRVIGRERNTLSAILRQGWDSGNLRTLTKNSPTRATGAHICITGHITVGELRFLLSTIDASNGYTNRHLWACAKRSKLLADPTMPAESEYKPIVQRLSQVIDAARGVERITRGDGAGRIWREVYPDLSRDRFGLAGDCTSRAEAQVTRLAALYCALDGLDVIEVEHMLAAFAVWDFCERSALVIFGDKTGNVTADKIRDALKAAGPAGMSRTDISALFDNNKPKAEIDQALSLLESSGQARSEKVQREGKGRPAERWFST